MDIRPIPGFDGYFASEQGVIYSNKSGVMRPMTLQFRNYYRLSFKDSSKKRFSVYVHELVLLAFVGPRPPGMVCRHLNGDARDNRVVNLAWGTPRENALDTMAHGRQLVIVRGSANVSARLTEEQVTEIRRLFATGCTRQELADRFGIGHQTVCDIICRKTWSHVAA